MSDFAKIHRCLSIKYTGVSALNTKNIKNVKFRDYPPL